MNEETKKKIANNMLEFLFDPTVIPVTKRLYFRPEEILKNQSYEKAKAESESFYGDQSRNSDFYPKNRTLKREAILMDRKTLIASLDILSQTLKESDPISKDLRTMAYTVSKMSDEAFNARLSTDIEAKKYETFPCPVCGTKVLKQTGYCVKCKKKVKPKEAAEEIVEAKKEPEKKEMEKDIWSKKASDLIKKALVADVVGTSCKPAEKEEEEKTAGKIKGPGKPDGTGPLSGTPACPMTKEKEEEKKKESAKKEETTSEPEKKADDNVVDTTVLDYDGIEMETGILSADDLGGLTEEEEKRLGQLFL